MNFYILTFNDKNIVKIVLYSIVIILFFVCLFNVFINPYGQAYVQVENLNRKSIVNLSRYEKLKILDDNNITFDAYVMGSSHISRIYAKNLDLNSKYKWITFPIESSMASEHYHYMKYFSKNTIKKIIYELDDNNLFASFLFKGNTLKNQKNDYSILDYFTFDTFKKSLDKIQYNKKNTINSDFNTNKNLRYKYFNGWQDRVLVKKKFNSLLTRKKPFVDKSISERELNYVNKIKDEFGDKIIPLVTFYHPYVQLMKKKKNYTNFLEQSINVFGILWHINPKYMKDTLSASYYFDATHTNSKFGKRVVKSIFGKDDFFIKIDKNTYRTIINEMYDFNCKEDFSMFTYSRIIDCK